MHTRWEVCAFASLVSCFVLLMCVRRNRDVVSLLALRPADMINAASDVLDFSVPDVIKNEVPMKQPEAEYCNVFEGKWVYEPSGNPPYDEYQCPFLSDQVSCRRNGRLDSEYEKWSWEANGCEIPRFNAKDMLERLRGKRVIIVGDSLNRNQWESLSCLLYSAIPSSRTHVDFHSGIYKVFKAKDYNMSVEFYWSPFLVRLDKQADGTRVLWLDKLEASARHWHGADVMLFNTGHWWTHRGKFQAWDSFGHNGEMVNEMKVERAFEMAMKTWAHWLDHNIDSTKTTVLFRSISPEHKGKNWCYNETQLIVDESHMTESFPKPMSEIVERTTKGMRTRVKYLNITRLSQYRKDAHPSMYFTKVWKQLLKEKRNRAELIADCSHWCLPGLPDTWNRLLYTSLLFEPKSFQTTATGVSRKFSGVAS